MSYGCTDTINRKDTQNISYGNHTYTKILANSIARIFVMSKTE